VGYRLGVEYFSTRYRRYKMTKHNELMQHFTEHKNLSGEIVQIEGYFEIEPAERGSFEDGVQIEPDYPAEVTLCYAYINGKEVSEFLSEAVIDKLQAKAYTYYTEQDGD
jgi:hypothetical protein